MSPASGRTWLLLRGLTRESGHWGAFPAMLSEHLPGAGVVAIDLPGNGRLNNERSPARIEATVESCRRQLQAMAIETPVHLLAMSLGAMVAVDWARRYPEELAACALVNTSLRPFSPWYRRLRPANYGALLGLLRPGQDHRRREETILRLTSRHRPHRDAVIDEWTALREAHPVSAANALRQLLAAARYRAPAEAPAVPLLVLSSARDALVDVQCSRALARAWGVAIIEHPTAGHDLPLDDGPWLARQIAEWVPSLTCARRPVAAPCPSG
jgi:pimeloyl-ACP methyl ester carboxylesterase